MRKLVEPMCACTSLPGTHITDALKQAKEYGYEYLYFNGEIYDVATGEKTFNAWRKRRV